VSHKKREIPDDIQRLLKTVVTSCEQEDRAVRERQIRTWKRLKLLWEGFQRVWYSETAHDWRIWDEQQDQNTDQAYYDKPINVFRAYLESIIAALSITVPPINCYPDNADDTLDLATAKAGNQISKLIYRHNDVSLLWLHALFIFCTEGMTACYSYSKDDKEYGTYEQKEYVDEEEEHQTTTCAECGFPLDDHIVGPDEQQPQPEQMQQPEQMGMSMQQPTPFPTTMQGGQLQSGQQQQQQQQAEQLERLEIDEFQPGPDDVALHAAIFAGKELCPACMMIMDPQITRQKFVITRLVGVTTQPKSRICMEAYGGLYVKVPNYAKTQADCPYLIFSKEIHYAQALEKYENLEGKNLIKKVEGGNNPGAYNQYDQWGRLSPQYQGEYPINVVTEKKAWLRPASFNVINDKDDIRKLKKLFPDGARVDMVNDQFADAENEALDDCWTLTHNPMSDFLHHDPLGVTLTSVQEITNDLISLVMQTIEHGVSLTFADPAVLNFKAFEQTEIVPGGMFPATPKSGKSIGDGFFETRTATLSQEVLPFYQNIQSAGQLVSGATPSIFGGALQGVGGETASGYSMSRAQAMQRLQNQWKIFTVWWKTIFGKVIPMYIKNIKDDERDVQKDKDGNFINVFIRKAELEGKIGKIELEGNENLPLTWAQVKDVVEKLLQNANPEVMKILGAPENLSLIHEALGIENFYVPGEDDIIKQYDEIKLLLNSEPIETGDPMNPEMPSVEIDPVFDNNAIEFEICRKWIISEAGRQAKTDNEAGYKNVLLHGKMHYMVIQQQMAQQQMAAQAQGAAPSKKPNPLAQEAPITGEGNVGTIQ